MSFDLKISEGDLVIGSDGDLQQVVDTPKLIQDILKIIITPLNSNVFFPFYGSSVSKGLIGSLIPISQTSAILSNQVKSALKNLQSLQAGQAQQGQNMSAAELLAGIKNVVVTQSPVDLRYLQVVIQAVARDLSESNVVLDIGL